MVELVLDDPRRELLELDPERLALEVEAGEGHGGRALDRDVHALQGEAALVGDLRVARPLDELRVDDGRRLLLVARLEHEEPLEDADLRRGEPDSARVVHQLGHPLREPREVLVETVDLVRAQPQHRVRVLPDLRQRDPAPRLDLCVELLVALVVGVLVLRLVVHLRRGHRASVTRLLGDSVTLRRVKATADRRRRPR